MESNNTSNIEKPFDEKTLVEKFTIDGNFKLGSALNFLESLHKKQETRLAALEEAMMFFSDWYNKTQRANIIMPENTDENGNTKLIL
jgi:hypothetical protein